MAAPLRRSTRIDGSAGGEPLSCGNQSTYNRVANAGNLHRLSPFQMPFGILHNLTGKSSLTFLIEKCHFITELLDKQAFGVALKFRSRQQDSVRSVAGVPNPLLPAAGTGGYV